MFNGGWAGRILRVDLEREKIGVELLRKELAHGFIGGRGFTAKLLYDEVRRGINPLGSENKIFITVGPCNGTLVPGSTRITIAAKSPQSGLIGDANSGGTMGAELKYAGYDVVVIDGKAKGPSYLWIDDDEVKLMNADHLWGKTTGDTRRILESDIGDPAIQVASIGPAGENLVRYANIISDVGRAHGRCGLGAVMGSKNLKAVVVRGTRGVRVADPVALEEAVSEMNSLFREDQFFYYGFTHYGPLALLTGTDAMGGMPSKNYSGVKVGNIASLQPKVFMESSYTASRSCFSCPMHCQHYFLLDKDPYKGTYTEGIEFVDATHFGTNLGNSNRDSIVKMHEQANELGLDICDTSVAMSWATECFERGLLDEKEIGGIRLSWGDHETFLQLINMIAYKKKFGKILSEGAYRASKMVGKGTEKYALHVKGLAFDGREPRPFMGWALGYSVSSRGAEHCRALYSEEGDTLVQTTSSEGKAEGIAWHENVRAVQNALEICEFCAVGKKMMAPQMILKFFSAVTGVNMSEKELLAIGERIVNVERAFNVREGLTRRDDTLPDRFLKEPIPAGPAKGCVVDLEPMIDKYYEVRGWASTTGFPKKTKLRELGLEEEIEELEALGKVA